MVIATVSLRDNNTPTLPNSVERQSEDSVSEISSSDTLHEPLPKATQPDDLADVCDPIHLNNRQSGRVTRHTKYYGEIKGQFEPAGETFQEIEVDVKNNAIRTISWTEDAPGFRTLAGEVRIIDGVKYSRAIIDGSESEWSVQTEGVESFGLSSISNQPHEGLEERSETGFAQTYICGLSREKILMVTDYGVAILDGVEVRHIAMSLDVSLNYPFHDADGWESELQIWVDSGGKMVQSLQTEIRIDSVDGQMKRSKSETLTRAHFTSNIVIKAPETIKDAK